MRTDQSEEFEEVNVSVQFIFNLLQFLWCESAHGITNPVNSTPTWEDDEALKENLTAGDLL